MSMSRRYKLMSMVWKAALVFFLIMGIFDPSMFLYAAIAGAIAYFTHKRYKKLEAAEILASEKMEAKKARRKSPKVRKGPTGLKGWNMHTGPRV